MSDGIPRRRHKQGMKTISNSAFNAIIRLLGSYADKRELSHTKAAERRRMTLKTLKYLKSNKRNK